MKKQEQIKRTAEHIKSMFSREGTGHDWWHVQRVWQNARLISKHEGGNRFVIEMAALLHELDDWKFSKNENSGSANARKWLTGLGTAKKDSNQICNIIENISFKGGFGGIVKGKEGKIVQDADRLDALGAIGIARAFAYGGHKGRVIYNPEIKPRSYKSFDEYKKKALEVNYTQPFLREIIPT